ncbi:MAG: two-component sensor histidine kinase [Phormidium sp. GEM2.Bin31]|nr:two-component sensor histidine kinase [Phormidium sp. BM_Day4_Bin.17]TVR15599.1 MAG: two-component sensor histidine kinase [Phormidium sp. GEM2.Bin31]UCJ11594.1 MAG: two-component sensor histidine kinase [Phormidium sp. PBR-2020]
MFGPTSFRRILLSRILLLSVPVLVIGQYVTFRKARSSLLETARQNLTESAIRKGNRIEDQANALKTQLRLASETAALESGSTPRVQEFLESFREQLPDTVRCLQVTNLETQEAIAQTCDQDIFTAPPEGWWRGSENSLNRRLFITADMAQMLSPLPRAESHNYQQTEITYSAPIYPEDTNEPAYVVSLRSILEKPDEPVNRPGSLTGSTVVIDDWGVILEHPMPNLIGTTIQSQPNAERLESLVGSALVGHQDFLHLSSFTSPSQELLSGYTAINSPISSLDEEGRQRHWVVLAITPLDNALAGLEPIRQVMFNLVLGLLAANLIATLYLAQDLARPVEKLGEYARNIECNTASEPMPAKFFIQEFNQLSKALNRAIERLKTWAQELEDAWNESKNANRLKSEFLATISHELRTPLNGIIGSLRLVRDGFCDDEAEEQEFLQRADDAAVHLLGIINDILDISKIEAGTLSVAIEAVNLMQLIDETMELNQATVRDKGLTLSAKVEGDEPIWVRADAAKLKQVLLNAIGNAVKFTETGEIRIEVRVAMVAADKNGAHYGGKRVVVDIIDTGIGVDPEDFEKLFKPFVMVDGSKTRRFGGTGLGLAISRNLMDMMNGSIRLDSAGIGSGTTVTLELPIAQKNVSLEKTSPLADGDSDQEA